LIIFALSLSRSLMIEPLFKEAAAPLTVPKSLSPLMNTSTQANHGWWSKQIKVWDTNPAWRRSSPAPEDFPTHTYDAESVTQIEDAALMARRRQLMGKLRRGPRRGGAQAGQQRPHTEHASSRQARRDADGSSSGAAAAPGGAAARIRPASRTAGTSYMDREVAALLHEKGLGAARPRTRLVQQRERRLRDEASPGGQFDLTVALRRGPQQVTSTFGGGAVPRHRPRATPQPTDEFLHVECDYMFSTNSGAHGIYLATVNQHKYRN
jgi:hypothetical protein